MKAGRIISLILVLAMLLLSVTSCSPDVDKLIAKADGTLSDKPYVVDVDIDYRCSDETVAGIFEQLERTETTVYFKDGNVMAKTDLAISIGAENYSFNNVYTVIDGMVYATNSYVAGSYPVVSKAKAIITAEEKETLVNDLTVLGGISASDFTDVMVGKDDGKYVILCDKLSNEQIIAAEKALISQLESSVDSVKATRVDMRIELDGKRYDSITIDCEYEFTIQGERYLVGMTVELDFDYDESFEITAPTDPDTYTSVKIDEIL